MEFLIRCKIKDNVACQNYIQTKYGCDWGYYQADNTKNKILNFNEEIKIFQLQDYKTPTIIFYLDFKNKRITYNFNSNDKEDIDFSKIYRKEKIKRLLDED